MGPLAMYEVDLNGSPTTAKLTERDAVRLGARPMQPPAAEEPATPPEDADDDEPEPEPPQPKAVRRPANKARAPKDKGA